MLKLPQLQALQALCYQRLLLSTVFGLQDGRYSVDQLIQKVCDDDNFNAVKSRILETETVLLMKCQCCLLNFSPTLMLFVGLWGTMIHLLGVCRWFYLVTFFNWNPCQTHMVTMANTYSPQLNISTNLFFRKYIDRLKVGNAFFFKQYFNERNKFLASFHMKSFNYTKF